MFVCVVVRVSVIVWLFGCSCVRVCVVACVCVCLIARGVCGLRACLVVWLDRLVGWCVGMFRCWLVDWLLGRLVAGLLDCVIACLIDWLCVIVCVVGCLIGRWAD